MLGLSLRLAVSSASRRIRRILFGEDNVLLTQNEDAIITQDDRFLKRQDP